jgi:hypothetical protein
MARFVRDAGSAISLLFRTAPAKSRVGKTGYAALDSLLRLEDRLIRVLERPEIPLHTNASENDIRGFVTKRKISGATVSEKGRQARDVMLGLAKTCAKLKIRLFDYLGARLGIPGPQIPNLANLVREALVSIST